jgi:AcrR family transcriptional regulator
MPRRAGDRNADFEATRAGLLDKLRPLFVSAEGAGAGLRVFAQVAGVSVATLRHYFGDREGIVVALLERFGEEGAPYLEITRNPAGPFPDSMKQLAAFVSQGFGFPVVLSMHAAGLREGARARRAGVAYLERVLEPTLQAVEQRLIAHMHAGDMKRTNARHAALAFVSPIYLAHLHQGAMCGDSVRPLDVPEMLADHVQGFLAAHAKSRSVR